MLDVSGVSLAFGGFHALRSVDLTAEPGQITGLIGPNGSGKSTLVNVIAGVLVPQSGEVRIAGRPLPFGWPERVASYGVGRTFQVPRLARRLTVFENTLAGARDQPGERLGSLFLAPGRVARFEREIEARALSILRRLALEDKLNDYAGELSGGQQKLLSMGMLLMADSNVMLLDEPAAGVNPVLIEQQIALLKSLKAEGRTILVIEHNMEMISRVCDRVFVLDAGEIIAAGTSEEIRRDKSVIRSYLGQPA